MCVCFLGGGGRRSGCQLEASYHDILTQLICFGLHVCVCWEGEGEGGGGREGGEVHELTFHEDS